MSKKLLALFCGSVLAYLLGEILTRIFVPDPAFRFENRIEMWQPDPLVGYKNQANFRGYAHGFIRVETNSLGFRDKEVSLQKPANTFRILGLGDSVMFGVGVQEQDTYLRILERKLNQTLSARTQFRFETVNTAVVGYSTHQELLTLQRGGVPLCPDLVIVGFQMNDCYPTEDPFGNVHKFHQPSKEDVRRRMYVKTPPVRLYFYRLARTLARLTRERALAKSKGTSRPVQRDEWQPGSFEARAWPIMQGQFRAMKRLAEDHDFRLLILLFPTHEQVESLPDHPLPQTRVGAFLASERIDYLDMFDAFRGRQREVFFDRMHLTVAGHRLTAETIFLYLKNHSQLPETDSRPVRCCSVQSDAKR